MAGRLCGIVCFSLMLATISGCGDGRTRMDRARVIGRVICEGQPAAHVMVYFMPKLEGKKGNVGKFGMGSADADGNFSISTYDTNDGAVVGKHYVRVGPPKGEKPSDFKCDCVLNEEADIMEVEVVGGQQNVFEVKLTKAAKQDLMAAKKKAEKDAED